MSANPLGSKITGMERGGQRERSRNRYRTAPTTFVWLEGVCSPETGGSCALVVERLRQLLPRSQARSHLPLCHLSDAHADKRVKLDLKIYILGYILVSNFIVMAVIPLVVLITMNFLLYKLLQSQQLSTLANLHRKAKRDQTVAAMFIIIVIVFVLCHTLKVTCSVYELFKVLLDNHHNWPDWTRHLIGLNHLLLGVNSSINILIYSWKDSKFRKALLQKVCFFWTDTKCHRMVPCPKQMTTSRESPNQGQQDSQIMR
eukprot:maker-scaffold25_size650667-snap-gene-0.19 protein:Tk06681 transcript:maker-scaffold25_size650667-snap-gene-0.19-mRNA-1 annotation:"fmrfamide receptor"